MTFQVRYCKPQQFQLITQWQTEENWNPGLYDIDFFQQNQQKSKFILGFLNEQPIGCFGAVQYDEKFAFIGAYIVLKQYRNKGFGKKLWKQSISKVSAQNIGLDSMLQRKSTYQKCGFKHYYTTIRYQCFGTSSQIISHNLITCNNINIQQISKYDNQCFPSLRTQIIKSWFDLPQSKSVAFVQQGRIKGYGVLRKTVNGHRIYPLFADSYQIAHEMLEYLRGFVGKQTAIYIDVPDNNENRVKFVGRNQMKNIWSFCRMYKNGLPEIAHRKVYAVCSIMFG